MVTEPIPETTPTRPRSATLRRDLAHFRTMAQTAAADGCAAESALWQALASDVEAFLGEPHEDIPASLFEVPPPARGP